MAEYIEREAALKATCEYCCECDSCNSPCVEYLQVAELPAADVVERPRWIPVTERLPDIGSNCLISPVSGCVAEGQFDGDGWTQYRWSAKLDKDTITHWMPLPEPPKENGKSEA